MVFPPNSSTKQTQSAIIYLEIYEQTSSGTDYHRLYVVDLDGL